MTAVIKTPRRAAASKKAIALPQPDLAADFVRGRDHAIAMMREAVLLGPAREPWRNLRDGEAQDNVVAAYLGDLDRDVSLRLGFTAILSAAIQNETSIDALAMITLAETQAGEIGADGTQGLTGDALEAPPAPVGAAPTGAMDEAADILDSAAEILDDLLNDLNDSAAYGAQTLLGVAQKLLVRAAREQTTAAHDDANGAIGEALAVLACVACKFERSPLRGVITLIGLVKEKHDLIVDAVHAARRGVAS